MIFRERFFLSSIVSLALSARIFLRSRFFSSFMLDIFPFPQLNPNYTTFEE
ncbi:hypothetical protein TDIS_1405 [Thermosulfurimonas dismutans]|uniref:Uncharacterized protein n=1 Tax=Thermosulfurimonas dismutans TaxID=999894 RepID=A0A179D377_9BACT|nr:hypothetical protein TDIS_1405 [Thermosulfurimonas dismutans]